MFASVPVDDDADDDASVFGQPLPPDDRLWRHPSELSWGARAAPARASARPWTLAMAAGTVGAILAVGAITVVNGLQPGAVEERFEPTVSSALSSGLTGGGRDEIVVITEDVSSAVARLEAHGTAGDITGSAVLVRDGAYLLTNAQLVDGADTIRIFTSDGTEREATLVGVDPVTAVAVLKVAAIGLPLAKIGSTTDLQVGERAIVIGAPAASGDSPSVTVGVVSAMGRRLAAVDGTPLHGMIQTDAPVAPGAAGGALVDRDGAVIGIATALSDGGSLGFGGATPIEVAMAAADDIITTGKAHHAWLGIEGDDLDGDGAAALGIKGGARVRTVADGSPAAAAGLEADDVIVTVDDTTVTSMSELVAALRQHDSGQKIRLRYLRNGKPTTTTVTLAER